MLLAGRIGLLTVQIGGGGAGAVRTWPSEYGRIRYVFMMIELLLLLKDRCD